MQIPTAQAVAVIQYPIPSVPYFVEKRGYEWSPKAIVLRLSDSRLEDSIRVPTFSSAPSITNSPLDAFDEVLDWDFVTDPDPMLALGTISVTLRHLDHDTSVNIEEAFD